MKPDDSSGRQQDGMLGLAPTALPRSPVLTAASVAHDVQRELYGQRDAAVALVERYARQEVLKALANVGEHHEAVVERLRQAEAKLAAIAELARGR